VCKQLSVEKILNRAQLNVNHARKVRRPYVNCVQIHQQNLCVFILSLDVVNICMGFKSYCVQEELSVTSLGV